MDLLLTALRFASSPLLPLSSLLTIDAAEEEEESTNGDTLGGISIG